MKIQIVKKATKAKKAQNSCDFMVDEALIVNK